MSRSSPTKDNLTGMHFGRLEVLGRSEKRGSRGARTVPLWECRCECGTITYKATDTLTNPEISMCDDCSKKYATSKMRESLGYVGGTQISKLKIGISESNNSSGVRGVYYDKKTGKYRARLKIKGQLINLGSYSSIESAIDARKKAEEMYFVELLDEVRKSQ